MRHVGPFTTYNRYLALNWRNPDALPIDKSMLGTFAAAESLSIMAFVKFCKGDATTYNLAQQLGYDYEGNRIVAK